MVSATSWPCAQVSMILADSDEAALIGGPNQGSLSAGSSSLNTVIRRRLEASNQASSSAPA